MDLQPVAPGSGKESISIGLPMLDDSLITTGKQQIDVAGIITYGDGFDDDPKQEWKFCMHTQFVTSTKELRLLPCDPDTTIPKMERYEKTQQNIPKEN